MVGRRRDQRDTWNGVACFGNHVVNLESRQLSTFTWFCALGDFDLYLFCIH